MLHPGEERGVLVQELGAMELRFELAALVAAPGELLLPAQAYVGEGFFHHQAQGVLARAALVLVLQQEGLELMGSLNP